MAGTGGFKAGASGTTGNLSERITLHQTGRLSTGPLNESSANNAEIFTVARNARITIGATELTTKELGNYPEKARTIQRMVVHALEQIEQKKLELQLQRYEVFDGIYVSTAYIPETDRRIEIKEIPERGIVTISLLTVNHKPTEVAGNPTVLADDTTVASFELGGRLLRERRKIHIVPSALRTGRLEVPLVEPETQKLGLPGEQLKKTTGELHPADVAAAEEEFDERERMAIEKISRQIELITTTERISLWLRRSVGLILQTGSYKKAIEATIKYFLAALPDVEDYIVEDSTEILSPFRDGRYTDRVSTFDGSVIEKAKPLPEIPRTRFRPGKDLIAGMKVVSKAEEDDVTERERTIQMQLDRIVLGRKEFTEMAAGILKHVEVCKAVLEGSIERSLKLEQEDSVKVLHLRNLKEIILSIETNGPFDSPLNIERFALPVKVDTGRGTDMEFKTVTKIGNYTYIIRTHPASSFMFVEIMPDTTTLKGDYVRFSSATVENAFFGFPRK